MKKITLKTFVQPYSSRLELVGYKVPCHVCSRRALIYLRARAALTFQKLPGLMIHITLSHSQNKIVPKADLFLDI